MTRAYSTHGERRNAYKVLVEKPEGNGPLGRPRDRWESNIMWEPPTLSQAPAILREADVIC
jgi:hypothetical protein